jgi:hemerythrin-like domain-containing protein
MSGVMGARGPYAENDLERRGDCHERGERDAMRHGDVFERTREEHRRVLEKLEALEAAAARDARGGRRKWSADEIHKFLEGMGGAFESHMRAEDDGLFPTLLEALPQAMANVEPLRAEHATLRTMLAQLAATIEEPAGAERDEQIGVQMKDLIDLVRIHIRKEEALVISVAERVLRPREVEALAARMSRGERGARTGPPHAGRSKGANS